MGKRLSILVAVLAGLLVGATGAAANPGHGVPSSHVVTDAVSLWSPSTYLTAKKPSRARSLTAAAQSAVALQFINVSDWHAQLDPLSLGTPAVNVGGAAQLSTYFKNERLVNPNTITLTSGDAFGASPPLASFFDEVPAVKAMNLMGFDVDALGNHNFDQGTAHLQRMIDLADFQYVSSNLKFGEKELDGVAEWTIVERGGVKVGIVGVTNPEAPTLVFPGRFGGIEIQDPVKYAEKAANQARARGADVVVAITHMGVTGTNAVTGEAVGPLIDFAKATSAFDVIFGDHTDIQYQGVINGALVHENRSKGATYARTTLSVVPNDNGKRGEVLSRSVQFVTPVSAAVTPDQAVVDMLAPYRAELADLLDGQIGIATGLLPRSGNNERLGEAAIGNVVTDALRTTYGTQIAFTNGGGLRSPLPSSYAPDDRTLRRNTPGYAAGPPYDLVKGDVYTLLPFGNQSLTRTVTGTQLWAALEHSVSSIPLSNGKFLQISGFKFEYSASALPGSRVVSVTLAGGTPILKDGTVYTAATNDFTNSGGDGYAMLADGNGTTRNLMANDVLEYITAQGTISNALQGRIVKLP